MGYIRKHLTLFIIILILVLLPLIHSSLEPNRNSNVLITVIMRTYYYPFKFLNFFENKIQNMWENYITLLDYKKENIRLREENKRLKSELFKMKEIQLQNIRLKKLLNFAKNNQYSTIAANVVAGSPSILRPEFVVIDKGENAGLMPGMPIVVEEGIVGRIYTVDKYTSQVILITDPISAVDAIVQRSRARGIVIGNGDGCKLKYIERESDLAQGDTVITSGKDNIYPKGLLIGHVTDVMDEGGIYSAIIEPAVDIDSIEEVLVLIGSKSESEDSEENE